MEYEYCCEEIKKCYYCSNWIEDDKHIILDRKHFHKPCWTKWIDYYIFARL
jgi:hypothetical protein